MKRAREGKDKERIRIKRKMMKRYKVAPSSWSKTQCRKSPLFRLFFVLDVIPRFTTLPIVMPEPFSWAILGLTNLCNPHYSGLSV
jgi:hypothetical protein